MKSVYRFGGMPNTYRLLKGSIHKSKKMAWAKKPRSE
jgi:hypothetical protein